MNNMIRRLIIFILLFGAVQTSFAQDTIKIAADLSLLRISENVYLHISLADVSGYGRVAANGIIYKNGNEAFLFDTPWNDAQMLELAAYLKDHLNLKITGFVPNHWHEDCMGGLSFLKSRGIMSYANYRTIEIAKEKGLPIPVQGFGDSLKLKLGDKSIYCYFFGAAHSMDNIVVWIPSERILFPGCMCKAMEATNLGYTADGSLVDYKATIEKVLRRFKSAKIVIPGHGAPGGPELLTHTIEIIPTISL